MARCEDFPCCGHELGCCPDFDDAGRQTNMVCVCGARHHGENGTSLCDGCLNAPEDEDRDYGDNYMSGEYEYDCRQRERFGREW